MGGSALYQKTVYGASGGRTGWMGSLCGDDGALLYPVRCHGKLPCAYHGKEAGDACLSAGSCVDAHDVRRHFYVIVPPAFTPSEAAGRAHAAGAEEHAGGAA